MTEGDSAQAAVAGQYTARGAHWQPGDIAKDVVQETAVGDDDGCLAVMRIPPGFKKIDVSAAVLAVAINKIPTVVVTVREGARAVDRELMQVAQAFRLTRERRFTRIYLPQLYPYLMASARSGLALIWKIVLVVELLGRSNGVGFQLHVYFQFFDIESILAYTFAFVGVILLIEIWMLRPLERRLTRWRP